MASILERNKKLKTPKKTMDEYAEDALYREVWEEVHTQKMYTFLKKYSKILIAVSVFALISVTGFQIWNHNHKKSNMAVSDNYQIAEGNMDAKALESLSKNSNSGVADLAAFKAYLIDKDVKKLEYLAENGNTRDFRDLARIHLANINGDKMTAKEFEKFMRPLDTKKSPFYYNAALLVAQKYISAGDKEHASKYIDKILKDENAPNVISATASTMK